VYKVGRTPPSASQGLKIRAQSRFSIGARIGCLVATSSVWPPDPEHLGVRKFAGGKGCCRKLSPAGPRSR